MNSKIKQLLTLLFGWPFSLIALYFIFRTFMPKVSSITERITTINIPLLFLGVSCFFVYYFLRTLVWQHIIKLFGYTISYNTSSYLWAISEFKRYIPGNIWSFLGRTVSFAEKGMSKSNVAKSLFFEQVIILFGALTAAVVSLPFLQKHIVTFLDTSLVSFQIIVLLFIACLIFFAYLPLLLKERVFVARFSKVKQLLPQIEFKQGVKLISLSTIAFIFFGLGYYFSITSFAFLHPQDIWSLSGFFVFSLLVGLLSLLTPTGLGVREGMIAIGLSKIMPLEIASFASLFGRVILVATELLFIVCTVVLSKLHKQIWDKFERLVSQHVHEVILGVSVCIFILYFTVISSLRYDNFYTGRFDLGNMDQTVWNTIQGNIFQLTNPNGTENVSRLAFHADFILIFLSPLYVLWSDPRMLLLLQAVVAGLGAVFIFLLTKKIVHQEQNVLALSVGISFLLNPSLQRSVLYDFHAVTLATTFLLGAFYFLIKKQYWFFVIFAFLAAITKEQIWLIVGFMGLFVMLKNIKFDHVKKKLHFLADSTKYVYIGLAVCVVSFAMFYYLLWHAIPMASPKEDRHFALSYFSENNDSPSGLVKSFLLTPDKTIEKLLQRNRIDYTRKLFAPVGYLPIFAPWYLAFPAADLFFNYMSDKGELQTIYYQYTAAITPFIFIAMLFGIKNILKIFTFLKIHVPLDKSISVFVLITAIYGAYRYGPLPGSREPNLDMITRPALHKEYIHSSLDMIENHLSVAASNSLGSHLSHREHIYVLPFGYEKADVVAFLLNDSGNQPSEAWHRNKVEELRKNSAYDVWFERGEFVVFKKISTSKEKDTRL